MSHSQFHSTNLFILRHAWLNLWDKHMTTGRINQVTISICADLRLHSTSTRVLRHFPQWAFVTRLFNCLCVNPFTVWDCIPTEVVLATQRPAKETPCFPFSQVSDQALPVHRTRITIFSEDYQRPDMSRRHTQSRRISKWLIASSVAIGK